MGARKLAPSLHSQPLPPRAGKNAHGRDSENVNGGNSPFATLESNGRIVFNCSAAKTGINVGNSPFATLEINGAFTCPSRFPGAGGEIFSCAAWGIPHFAARTHGKSLICYAENL